LCTWRSRVVGLVENYVSIQVTTKAAKALFGETTTATGKIAIQRKFQHFKKMPSTDQHRQALRSCEIFRMYKWCLSDADSKTLDDLIQEHVAGIKGTGPIFPAIANGVAGTLATSASASSGSKMVLHGHMSAGPSVIKDGKKPATTLKVIAGLTGKSAKLTEYDRAEALLDMFSKPSSKAFQ
jgi:hypothetical protein